MLDQQNFGETDSVKKLIKDYSTHTLLLPGQCDDNKKSSVSVNNIEHTATGDISAMIYNGGKNVGIVILNAPMNPV